MNSRLTKKAQSELVKTWMIEAEGMKLLSQVADEWNSDPMSVACFDLRIVEQAKKCVDEWKRLKPELAKALAGR